MMAWGVNLKGGLFLPPSVDWESSEKEKREKGKEETKKQTKVRQIKTKEGKTPLKRERKEKIGTSVY